MGYHCELKFLTDSDRIQCYLHRNLHDLITIVPYSNFYTCNVKCKYLARTKFVGAFAKENERKKIYRRTLYRSTRRVVVRETIRIVFTQKIHASGFERCSIQANRKRISDT